MLKLSLKFFKLFCALSFWTTGVAMAVCPPPGITISDGTSLAVDESQIGIANDGTAIAVWREFDGTNTLIKSAFLIEGGSWSTPDTLTSFLGDDPNAFPQIAVSAITGNAVAIWEQFDTGSGNSFIYASQRPADTGMWQLVPDQLDTAGPLTTISNRGQKVAINTVGPNDDYAVAIWYTDLGLSVILQSSLVHIVGFVPGTWSSPIDVVPATTDILLFPDIAVDTTGIAYAIWENATPGSIEAATLPLNGLVWSSPTTLSQNVIGSVNLQPHIALGSTGFLAAIWTQGNFAAFSVQAATYQAGSWSLPDTISSPSSGQQEVDVDVDLGNNVVAIWREGSFINRTIKSAYRPFSTGIWGSPLQVSVPGVESTRPDVVLIDSNAYAVWDSYPLGPIIAFSTSFNGGAWLTPCTNISPSGDNSGPAHLAVDPTGYGVIAWDNNTQEVIQATSFFSPPNVTAVSPTSGSINGQNAVLITGTFFYDVNTVEFGAGNFAPSFIVLSPTQILAIVPTGPLAPPSVDVIVTTANGPSPANPPDDLYSFIDPICWQR